MPVTSVFWIIRKTCAKRIQHYNVDFKILVIKLAIIQYVFITFVFIQKQIHNRKFFTFLPSSERMGLFVPQFKLHFYKNQFLGTHTLCWMAIHYFIFNNINYVIIRYTVNYKLWANQYK